MILVTEGEHYPTRNGLPISPLEIYDFTDSNLNLEAPRNWNDHHSCWTRKQFGKNVLYLTLRSLQKYQMFMPVDIHDQLHQEYAPIELPDPRIAYSEIERAFFEEEKLRLRQPAKKVGKYVIETITGERLSKCKYSCDALIKNQRGR